MKPRVVSQRDVDAWRPHLRRLLRFIRRSAAAGFCLAVPALVLTLILNHDFPYPGRDALVLGILFAVYYSALWALVAAAGAGVASVAAAAGGRIRGKGGQPPDAPVQRGLDVRGQRRHVVLGLCFLYVVCAYGLNASHNRTALPDENFLLLLVGAGLNLIVGAAWLGSALRRRRAAGGSLVEGPGLPGAAVTLGIVLLLLLPIRGREAPDTAAGTSFAPIHAETGLRVILLGIDSASWAELDPLLDRGELPHLARLIEEGSRGTLRSFVPTESPLLWASIATGKLPAGHGVRFFLKADFAGVDTEVRVFPRKLLLGRMEMIRLMRFSVIDGRELRAAAFWDVASSGHSVGVVNWWQTYPAPAVNGYLVSDHVSFFGLRHDSPDEPGLTHPHGLARRISRREEERPLPGPEAVLSRFRSEAGTPDPFLDDYLYARCYEPDEKTARIAEQLLEALGPVDLLAVYWNGLDPVGHYFYCFAHPERFRRVDPGMVARYGETLRRYTRYTDEVLGRVLRYRDERTVVMVVSDHGMVPHKGLRRFYSRYVMGNPRMCASHRGAPPGIIVIAGPGIRQGAEMRDPSVLDVTPTALALLGYPPADDMDGRVLEEALEPEIGRLVSVLDGPDTYDAVRLPLSPPGETAGGEGRNDQYRAHLEALGYLE